MESQIWLQLASSVWGEFRKGTMASAHLDAEHFSFFLCLSRCYPNAGVQRVWIWVGESVCGFFKRNCLGFQKFLPPTQSPLVFAARSYGNLSFWHWNPGLGGLVWYWDSLLPRCPFWIFSTIHGCGTSLFLVCAPPTSLDGCGFFNSIVIRLIFNSISESSEWWLFSILVVILKWLWEEASHVRLCHHLDRQPSDTLSRSLCCCFMFYLLFSQLLFSWVTVFVLNCVWYFLNEKV